MEELCVLIFFIEVCTYFPIRFVLCSDDQISEIEKDKYIIKTHINIKGYYQETTDNQITDIRGVTVSMW